MMSEIREECGVFGVYSPAESDVARTAYYGLFSLQHRGQESCGIVVNDDGLFRAYKDTGLVNDVFTPAILEQLGCGGMALGHVRYGTTGSNDRVNAQPIVVNHIKGKMALAHNGNLTNCRGRSSTPPAIRRSSPMSSPRSGSMRHPSRKRSAGRWIS